jgi:biotin carboxylase
MALAGINGRHPISAVLTSRDAVITQVAFACEQNGIQFTPSAAISTARNKALTLAKLKRSGFHIPRFRIAKTILDIPHSAKSIGFPCVLKPASGHMSMFCFRVLDHSDVRNSVTDICKQGKQSSFVNRWILENGFVCQEWIEGPIVSAQIAAVSGIYIPIVLAIGTRQEENPCMGFGSIIPADLPKGIASMCFDYAIDVCRTLGLSLGVFDIEMVLSNKGPILLEVNPRRMGGEMPAAYEMATGRSLDDILLEVYSGNPVSIGRRRGVHTSLVRKLIARVDGKIKGNVWKALSIPAQVQNIRFFDYALGEGLEVHRLQILGRLILVSQEAMIAFSVANTMSAKIESTTGVRLVSGTYPIISESKGAIRCMWKGESP